MGIFIIVAIIFLGMIMGSFATMLCYRIPREIPIGLYSHTRSQCTSCEKLIPWYRNIPIVSYLLLRGKCANCHAKINIRYLLIEITTTAFFLATYLIYTHSSNSSPSAFAYWGELAKLLIFTLGLIVVVFIDLEFRIIPDRISLGGWALALIASFLWQEPPFLASLVGGLLGFGIFFLLAWSYEKFKGIEGLGFGDVKMMGWLGSWVGIFGVPFVILVASLSGLAVGLISMRKSKDGMQTAIPFGPFLAFGAYLAWALQCLGLW